MIVPQIRLALWYFQFKLRLNFSVSEQISHRINLIKALFRYLWKSSENFQIPVFLLCNNLPGGSLSHLLVGLYICHILLEIMFISIKSFYILDSLIFLSAFSINLRDLKFFSRRVTYLAFVIPVCHQSDNRSSVNQELWRKILKCKVHVCLYSQILYSEDNIWGTNWNIRYFCTFPDQNAVYISKYPYKFSVLGFLLMNILTFCI